jgi:hypothetical protein
LIFPRQKIVVMYSPKCASATIVYWWLSQIGLLESALRFSKWPHDFEANYRGSKEYLRNALDFDPARYKIYKFTRNPITRAASSFVHLLNFPGAFNISKNERSMSFMDFLDRLERTNYFGLEGHLTPQLTFHERLKQIVPEKLKIEAGLNDHLRALESRHGLAHTEFMMIPEVRQILQWHRKMNLGTLEAGPDDKIPFGKVPKYRNLLTPEAIAKIAQIYACDFEAYGYDPEADF